MKHITEFDTIFLSYDEPNAERNYADLLDKAPWAKRVHGVKGFDAAHRACAELSETDWFVTVDADSIVRPEFFDVDMTDHNTLSTAADVTVSSLTNCVSWNGLNAINGLSYGNGGVKLWRKSYVLVMQTHENADDPRKAVDFCWEDGYVHRPETFSDVYINASPYQAFRVGFREGVKLALDRGKRVSAEMMRLLLHKENLRCLRIWCCVGMHAENGLWAIYGARTAWLRMCNPNWDHTLVRDYDWFKDYWQAIEHQSEQTILQNCQCDEEEILRMTKIDIPLLESNQSAFFRDMFN